MTEQRYYLQPLKYRRTFEFKNQEMKMTEAVGTEKWVSELDKSKAQHLRRIRRLKDDIRGDKRMDPLDRLVLGVTGSAEQLTHYQALVKKVGEQVGKPLIVINRAEKGHVVGATGGIISDEVDVVERYHPTLSNERKKPLLSTAKLDVPVLPVATYAYFEHARGRGEEAEKIYHNGDATAFDSHAGIGRITIARLELNERDNRGFDPEDDYLLHVDRSNVLLGREEIFDSPYFTFGVGKLLLALEEQVQSPSADLRVAS